MKLLTNLMITLIFSTGIFAQVPYKGAEAITQAEFVYKEKDVSFPSCHASTIEETRDGFIASWFGGTAEKDPDVGIWVSTYSGSKWAKPIEVANGIQSDKKRFPTWNPVLFSTGSEIKLFYKVGPTPRNWWGELISAGMNPMEWSKSEKLPENIFGPIKNKPVLLPNGDLLSPSSTEDKGWRVHMEISPDMGKTWSRTEALNDGKKISLIQPTILLHPNGKVQMLCRSRGDDIFTSWSDDNGRTWGEFKSMGLPNPNSGIDAVTLKNGLHVLIYNHVPCKKGERWGDRHILNLAISKDGINWEAAVLLENDSDIDAEYSYPAVIQSKDGFIHITYTWNRKLIKHVVVDPKKIKSKPILNGKWPQE